MFGSCLSFIQPDIESKNVNILPIRFYNILNDVIILGKTL